MTKIEEIEKSMIHDTCERAFLFSLDGDLILPEKKIAQEREALPSQKKNLNILKVIYLYIAMLEINMAAGLLRSMISTCFFVVS